MHSPSSGQEEMKMNMNKTTFAAALLAATFAISPTPSLMAADLESQFVQLDLDSDGRLALSEWSW
jgi:hypothetical protein